MMLSFFAQNWPTLSQLGGVVLEVLGVFFMASRYLNLVWYEIPVALFSALWRSEYTKDCVATVPLSSEKGVIILQGLAMISLGFMLQAIPYIHSLVTAPFIENIPRTSG